MKKIDSSLAVRKRPGRRALASLESLISLAWLQGVKSWRAGQSSATALLFSTKLRYSQRQSLVRVGYLLGKVVIVRRVRIQLRRRQGLSFYTLKVLTRTSF